MKSRFRQHLITAKANRPQRGAETCQQRRSFSEDGLPTPDLIDDWLRRNRRQLPAEQPTLDPPSNLPAAPPPKKEKNVEIIPVLEPDENKD